MPDKSNKDRQHLLEILREDGVYLQHVRNQNKELCLEAVRSDGLALKFVHKQDKETALQQCSKTVLH